MNLQQLESRVRSLLTLMELSQVRGPTRVAAGTNEIPADMISDLRLFLDQNHNKHEQGLLALRHAQARNRVQEENIGALTRQLVEKEEHLGDAQQETARTKAELLKLNKLASMGTLAAGIAHEIKNPLGLVSNFSTISGELLEELREDLAGKGIDISGASELNQLIGDLTENQAMIGQHAARANNIIRSMMNLARGGVIHRATVDINLLVDEYTDIAYHGTNFKELGYRVALYKDYDYEIRQMEVVPQDLNRAIINLVTNAIDAVNTKKIAEDGSYKPMVWICTKGFDDHVEITVKDNGKGVLPEHIKHLFEPFFSTKSSDRGNVGLGLAISREIVEDIHGGKLKVSSIPNVHTTFTIGLPKTFDNDGVARLRNISMTRGS
jgi:signal transduction histidine kinase